MDPAPARKRGWRAVGIAVAVVLALLLVVPLVWPVPPLQDVAEPREIAGPQGRFVTADGIEFHWQGSVETTGAVVFIHGAGAWVFSWREQLPAVAERTSVVAFDRPGFGFTERPLRGEWTGDSPYSAAANARQTVALLDELGIEKAVLVGHSAGGTVAALVALEHPGRVSGLVLEAPAIFERGGATGFVAPLLRTPQARRVGPLLVRRFAPGFIETALEGAFADPDDVTPEVVEGYRAPLSARDWDRGLWELVTAPRAPDLSGRLEEISVPTLVITGDSDTFVPPDSTRQVAAAIPGADLVVFEETGHVPHEERPERFNNELYRFLDTLADAGAI